MESINTLQDFMLHTKNVIYVIIVLMLLAMPAIWAFLSGQDDD